MIPGEYLLESGDVIANAGRRTVELTVENKAVLPAASGPVSTTVRDDDLLKVRLCGVLSLRRVLVLLMRAYTSATINTLSHTNTRVHVMPSSPSPASREVILGVARVLLPMTREQRSID